MSRKKRALAKGKQQPEVKKPVAASGFNFSHKWVIGLILLATFLAFANTVNHGFAYDDTTQILQNETIRSFSNISTAFTKEVWFWRQMQDKDPNAEAGPTTPYYRPLFTVYLMVGWSLFGTQAAGWHLTNVLMHLLAVYFAFLILKRITNDIRLTSIATLLFALHPLRTESVAWISGMTDLFLALFLLPSFYLYMIYRERKDIKHLLASLFLFLLATFSKEPAIALPIFIFVYEVFIVDTDRKPAERIRQALLFSSAFLLVSVFYFILRYQALGFVLSDSKYVYYPFHQVLLTIPLATCKYIGLLFWPVNLSIFHATPIVESPLSLRFIIPLVVLVALAAALWRLRKNMVARFAALWFAVNLLPVLNLGAFGEDFLVQERYVYIPSIGFSLLLSMALVKIPIDKWFTLGSRRTAQVALVGLIALLMTGKTIAQNGVWKDDMTLWEYGAEVAPDQPMSHFVLGHKYINQQKWDKVAEELEKYMEMRSDNLVVITNLASAHLVLYQEQMQKNPAKADRAHLDRIVALYEKAHDKADHVPALLDTMGVVYTYDTGFRNYDRAIAFIGRALEQEPRNPFMNLHMVGALLRRADASKGDFDKALHHLNTVIEVQPNLPDTYKFLAYAYKGKGQINEAVENFNHYLQMQPNASDAAIITQQLKDLREQLDKT
jgi:tetratricopeptide (TPR) repeat protein